MNLNTTFYCFYNLPRIDLARPNRLTVKLDDQQASFAKFQQIGCASAEVWNSNKSRRRDFGQFFDTLPNGACY